MLLLQASELPTQRFPGLRICLGLLLELLLSSLQFLKGACQRVQLLQRLLLFRLRAYQLGFDLHHLELKLVPPGCGPRMLLLLGCQSVLQGLPFHQQQLLVLCQLSQLGAQVALPLPSCSLGGLHLLRQLPLVGLKPLHTDRQVRQLLRLALALTPGGRQLLARPHQQTLLFGELRAEAGGLVAELGQLPLQGAPLAVVDIVFLAKFVTD
mmetsp:Transcript_7918/g.22679  ORF Transcript_7918/g.22679 Transcript_7918/m.22679 type:complete len:210 (-) Transcript_7918:501-1130(-)